MYMHMNKPPWIDAGSSTGSWALFSPRNQYHYALKLIIYPYLIPEHHLTQWYLKDFVSRVLYIIRDRNLLDCKLKILNKCEIVCLSIYYKLA